MMKVKHLQRFIITAFILLNIGTVLKMHVPQSFSDKLKHYIQSKLSPEQSYEVEMINYRFELYAALSGLNPKWEMFSNVKGPDWRFLVLGVCNDHTWTLPLPGQTKRPFINEFFFDFKEAKFKVNIGFRLDLLKDYTKYLCKTYSQHNHHKTQAIQILVRYQDILTPERAMQLGRHLAPNYEQTLLEYQKCT